MGQGFGIESPGEHSHAPLRKRTRFLVVIGSGGSAIARLFLDTREPVAEFDASTEEVTQMTQGLTPDASALGPEWDRALAGHSVAERGAAEVYTLDL